MQAPFAAQAVRPVSELIRQARQGVLRRRVDEIARIVNLTDKEMAQVLNMSVRSLHGKPPTEALTLAAGERLLLFEALVRHGLSVFDGRADLLSRWLRTPLAELANSEKRDEDYPPVSVRQLGSFTQPVEAPAPGSTDPVSGEDTQSLSNPPQSPLSVLDTVSGFSLAEDVLGRIEWGLIS